MSQLNVIAVKTHHQWICTCNNQVHREFKRPFFAPYSVLDKSSSLVFTSLSSSSLCKRLEYKCPRCFAISMRLVVLKSCDLFSTVVGGAVASWLKLNVLVSGSSGPGSNLSRGNCVVFLGKTLNLTVPLSLSTQLCNEYR